MKLIDDGPVLLDLDDGVGHLRPHRAETYNGLDVPSVRALFEAVRSRGPQL